MYKYSVVYIHIFSQFNIESENPEIKNFHCDDAQFIYTQFLLQQSVSIFICILLSSIVSALFLCTLQYTALLIFNLLNNKT